MPSLETVVLSSIAASLAFLAVTALVAVTSAFRHGGRREEPVDSPKALSVSRLTIPVSLLVPLGEHATSAAATTTIAALLNLNYPEFEVIVVAEDLPAALWRSLKDAWGLEAREFFYRQTLATAAVQKIYRSSRDPRLMIVDKTHASQADTLNCGINLARFRYVCPVDVGIVFDADALLRTMSAPLRDPAAVVAASSHVETGGGNLSAMSLQSALQRLGSIRSMMESRVIWRTLDAGIGPHDGIVAWRRDAIVLMGGFSTTVADPGLDMMVRLQAAPVARISGTVARSTEIFGQTDPRPLGDHARLVARRRVAALQAAWAGRRLAGSAGRAFAFFVLAELVTPLLQGWVITATILSVAAGWLAWRDLVLVVLVLSLGRAILSNAALLLRGSAPGGPTEHELWRLLLVAPLDFVASGAAAVYARSVGIGAFVRAALAAGTAS